jgi:hypothetical protein
VGECVLAVGSEYPGGSQSTKRHDREFAAEGQAGPVWFLPGTFGTSVEREVIVPAGKTLFMPVFNWIFGSGVYDCDPTVPEVECDVPSLQAGAAQNTEAAEILEVKIDGVPVSDVRA